MTKLAFLLFVWGPAMVGFSLGWLARHPQDWTGPAVVAPVGLVLGGLTYGWGLKKLRTLRDDVVRLPFIGGMIAGLLVGLALFAMLTLGVIG